MAMAMAMKLYFFVHLVPFCSWYMETHGAVPYRSDCVQWCYLGIWAEFQAAVSICFLLLKVLEFFQHKQLHLMEQSAMAD